MAKEDSIDFKHFVAEIERTTPPLIKGMVQSFTKSGTGPDAGKITDFWVFLDHGRLPIDSTPEEREFYKRTVTRMVEAGVLASGYLDLINEWRFVRGKDAPKKA
jgi:hypothetical protein